MLYKNGVVIINRLESTTANPVIAGNITSIVSLTAVTVSGSDLLHADIDTSTAVGDLVQILSGTGVTTGVYRITAVGANQVTVDRAPGGAGTNIVLTIYRDCIIFTATDGVNGQRIMNYSHQNKPLQIGGDVLVATSGLTADDVTIGGRIGFPTGTNDNGIVLGSLGTATKAIDFSGSGLSGDTDYQMYLGTQSYWAASGILASGIDAASTNTVLDVLKLYRTTTGTAGNSIGTGIALYSEDASGTVEEAGRIQASFPVAAHATQTGLIELLPFGATTGTGLAVVKDASGVVNVIIGATALGTSAAGWMGVKIGTAPTDSPADVAQWGAADFNGAVSSRLYTRTEEGQFAAIATINETAIYYGVSWNESADSYTRTGRTTGHKVGASLPDSMLPIQRMMRRVTFTDAGAVNYVLGATDSTKKIDGVTASVLTGADGQVMVQIPKFWYRYSYAGTTHTWEISPVALAGFDVHPAFVKDGVEVAYRYYGAYEASLYDTSLTAYVDGIYQTAVSAVFATADDSITIATRSNWATNLTVGQKIVISGTVSNNGTLTVASLVSGTAITVSENLTNETAAATVISTERNYTATTGDKLSSVSGKAAINYLTRANARVIALNRGAGWRQNDFSLEAAIELLNLVEYASFYSQSMIGAGITNVTDWSAYNDYNPIAKSGNSNSIGNATGNTAGAASAATESTKYLSYRGIENWYGHLWKWADGFNINDNIPYVTNVGTDFADDTAGASYARLKNVLGVDVTLHNADGYPATLQKMSLGFLPVSVGASSSTKITDYYWEAAGWRVAFFGGNANSGTDVGGFAWHLNHASGDDLYRNIGARLSF